MTIVIITNILDTKQIKHRLAHHINAYTIYYVELKHFCLIQVNFPKQTALNLVHDGHLGLKPAAKAFNIPIATLYNASKRQGANAIEHQTTVFRKKQL